MNDTEPEAVHCTTPVMASQHSGTWYCPATRLKALLEIPMIFSSYCTNRIYHKIKNLRHRNRTTE